VFCGFVIEDSLQPDEIDRQAPQASLVELPDNVMHYLLGSRYCETDRLSKIAWKLFGQTPQGWPLVQAIVDYVHDAIHFDYMAARPTKTAWDVFHERTGVCGDYAHLAIALCRCMNIPARYCTGYLGDMDLPAIVGDMDFPRRGLILMARGRDAADAALTTTFGPVTLSRFKIYTDEDRLD